jgi:hypothetical protein
MGEGGGREGTIIAKRGMKMDMAPPLLANICRVSYVLTYTHKPTRLRYSHLVGGHLCTRSLAMTFYIGESSHDIHEEI